MKIGRPKGDKQMTDKKLFTTIDEYISTFPGEIQAVLEKVRQAIHKAAPEAAETMSYGIPTFNLNGKHVLTSGSLMVCEPW